MVKDWAQHGVCSRTAEPDSMFVRGAQPSRSLAGGSSLPTPEGRRTIASRPRCGRSSPGREGANGNEGAQISFSAEPRRARSAQVFPKVGRA